MQFFVCHLFLFNVLKKAKRAKSVKSFGWISMERYQNQNTCQMRLTVCITAQYKSVTMMGFKVKRLQKTCSHQAYLVLLLWWKTQLKRNHRFAKVSKQFSNREHNSRSNKGDNKARRKVTSLIFIILWHWWSIYEMADWKWWQLQERSCNPTNSYKML